MNIKAGHKFYTPDNRGGYTLTRDLNIGDPITYSLFEPFGDVEVKKPNGAMPAWFAGQLLKLSVEMLSSVRHMEIDDTPRPKGISKHIHLDKSTMPSGVSCDDIQKHLKGCVIDASIDFDKT